jgi:predicted ArsR family transcriptional regulator
VVLRRPSNRREPGAMTPSHRSSRRSRRAAWRDHYAKILDALERHDGTIYEIAAATGLTHVQVARRMPELEAMAKVTTTDETRASPSGRGCRVWDLAS